MPRARIRWLLAAMAVVATIAPAASAEPPRPTHKDSRFQWKEVAFTTAISPAEARPGDTVTYTVTAKLAPTWHIYAHARSQPANGPRSTQFDLFGTDGLEVAGDWKASKEPTRKTEKAFDNLVVEYFEDEVSWSLPLRVPARIAPGEKTVRCQVSFMICDPHVCKPPSWRTLPDAALTVKPGGAAGGSAALLAAPLMLGEVKPPSGPSASPIAGSVQESIEKGIVPFLLSSAAGGLLALLMPCVWPMVPVTVNFFVKQGQAKGGGTTRLAVTYCVAIIGIFTLVGLLFSALLGSSSLNRLANNPWLNVAVAGIFLAFGLSLLGLFEISLPSFLLNASAQGEGRGGLVGVMFMALTLTITSFTCTFPVVGGLLVLASKGQYFYPILGMATFATVLALPFFVLALAPGLLSRLPRSGDWMNAVKVVGGLVEIGAAFKFINTAEIGFGSTPDRAWFDSSVLLSIWVVLSLICGVYLLGLFKTDHDQGEAKVGAGRILSGALFLTFALYLAPALFGYPPRSRIYDRLVVGLLPADSGKLDSGARLASDLSGGIQGPSGGSVPGAPRPSATPEGVGQGAVAPRSEGRDVPATSHDPNVAIAEEKRLHGVLWGMSYDAAIAEAKRTNRPVLIDFTGVNCANCRLMERSVMPLPEVVAELRKFVPVQLYTDFVPIDSITPDQRQGLAEDNLGREQELAQQSTSPLYVVVGTDGKVVAALGGYNEPPTFLKFLRDALAKHQAMAGSVADVRG